MCKDLILLCIKMSVAEFYLKDGTEVILKSLEILKAQDISKSCVMKNMGSLIMTLNEFTIDSRGQVKSFLILGLWLFKTQCSKNGSVLYSLGTLY